MLTQLLKMSEGIIAVVILTFCFSITNFCPPYAWMALGKILYFMLALSFLINDQKLNFFWEWLGGDKDPAGWMK